MVAQQMPNSFMINVVVHDTTLPTCLCDGCKGRRIDAARNITRERLTEMFMTTLPSKEKYRLNKLFENTINQIVIGKVFKVSSLEDTGYTYFKSWARHEPEFINLSPKEFSKLCEKVNEASSVFDSWNIIVRNLTDNRMKEVDARRFSVRQFYLAKNIDWCIRYNEMLRKKGKKTDDQLYAEDKYAAIIRNIFSSGILDDIGHDPQVASTIGNRLQSDMVAYCRRRYHPY